MEKQRVALVTGGAGGLGSAICRVLIEDGFRVYVLDRARDQTAAVCEALGCHGHGVATPVVCDLADERSIRAALEEVDAGNSLDLLVNNAGADVTLPVETLSLEQWDRITAVNLRAPFILSKAFLPAMCRNRRGTIINIVSTAALRAWPNASAYHASKWGLLGLSHALHTEARSHQVRVTAVIAGGMRTPFLTDRFPDLDLATLQDPANVAEIIRMVLKTPPGSVVPQISVLPMQETSWP